MARPKSPEYGSRVLEPGLDGRDVWELQIKLIGWGSGTDDDGIGQILDPVRVHGKFDSTTADAVKRFQKAHKMPVTGVVTGAVFRAVDREAAEHPLHVADLACPCAAGKNKGKSPCRCARHKDEGECTGFGKQRFAGKFLSDHYPSAPKEKLDLYDIEEHDGVDKAVLWAARALMHRAGMPRAKVVAGYKCWQDNYHTTDDTRWEHRRSTLHLGKSVEIVNPGVCVETGNAPCPECDRIRGVALAKCGFQLRWQEPDRVAIAEGSFDARPPSIPFAVHLDTARRKDREKDDYAKTDLDAIKPLYQGKVGVSFPLNLGDGLDPRDAPSGPFFDAAETPAGGWFPIGITRLWHGGVNLKAAGDATIHAIDDGEIVGCRVGEAEGAKPHGSRNFVLVKHTWKKKTFYSLYMHLDAESATAASTVEWRRQLFLRTKDNVEALEPGGIYLHAVNAGVGSLTVQSGLAIGDRAETTGAEVDPKTLDPTAPGDSKVIKLVSPPNAYVYTRRAGKDVGKLHPADAAIDDAIKKSSVIGLKDPIKVFGADVIGRVPKNEPAGLPGKGTFLHLEVFSEENLLTDKGWSAIDAGGADAVLDRKKTVEALVKAKLLVSPPDGVMSEAEVKDLPKDPDRGRFRSVVLKMPSGWSLDWKAALAKSPTFSFMKDDDRDKLGDAYNDYRFWADVKSGGGALPGSDAVHHYNPIAFLLQAAFHPDG